MEARGIQPADAKTTDRHSRNQKLSISSYYCDILEQISAYT